MTAIVKPLSLPVQGMTCAGCVSHVEGALKELPGVSGVAVNLGTNKASLAYDPSRVSLSDLTRAIAEVGYSVPTAELTLEVSGMTCASCVAHVEGALTELDGVSRLRYRFTATGDGATVHTRYFSCDIARWVSGAPGLELGATARSRLVAGSEERLIAGDKVLRVRFAVGLDPREHVVGF